MELESLGEALHGLCRRSEQGFDKTPGLGLIQLDGIVAANDFLSGVTDMGHDEGRKGGALQRCGASQQRLVLRSDPGDESIRAAWISLQACHEENVCRIVPQFKILNCGRILGFRRPDVSYDGQGQVVPATVKKNKKPAALVRTPV